MKLHNHYQIRWKNFRCFEDTGWITIKPITIVLGPNSSGKSSLLSPLLLLNQTINSRDNDIPLLTRGPLADVGWYRDLVHRHDVKRDVVFGIRYHTHDADDDTLEAGSYPPGAIEITFRGGDEPDQITLEKYKLFDIFRRPYLSRQRLKSKGYGLRGLVSRKDMTTHEARAIQSGDPVNFLFSPTSPLGRLRSRQGRDDESKTDSFSDAFSHYLQTAGYSFSEIRSVFRDISYLGPLRQRPQRYYRVAAEKPRTVGPQGENAPTILQKSYESLSDKLSSWLARFEFGETLECTKLASDLFALHFCKGQERVNLADAGFGASQVLPLIVQAIAAPFDSLTIAEQPEIHLNPRLQCLLADLFVEMANSGHRVLVETHSEHLLLRLRRLIALRKVSNKDVALYFAENDEGGSTIREVPIGDDGHIEKSSWPRGFFDESLRESLALAAAQSQAAE